MYLINTLSLLYYVVRFFFLPCNTLQFLCSQIMQSFDSQPSSPPNVKNIFLDYLLLPKFLNQPKPFFSYIHMTFEQPMG